MLLSTLRLVFYIVGTVMAIAVAGRMFAVPNRLSYIFGSMMMAWAINTIILAAMLIYMLITGDKRPPWGDLVLTVNSILIGISPAMVYSALLTLWNGSRRR